MTKCHVPIKLTEEHLINKMNASATAVAFLLLGFSSVTPGDEPKFPPPEMNLKEAWTTLEKKNFGTWEIEEFVGWSGVADGGSIAFEFRTTKDVEFDVLVANPSYWTAEEKEKKRQVIYVIESGRFYLLVPDSEQEEHLLKMLQLAEKGLKGDGRTSRQRIEKLRATIQNREAVDNRWPLTPEEIEADDDSPVSPDDPFAE